DADDVERRADHEQRHDNRLPRPPRHHLSGIEMVMAGMRDEEKWWGEKPLTRRYAPPSPRFTGRGATVMGTAAVMGGAAVMRVARVMCCPSPRMRGEGGRRPDEGHRQSHG